MKVDCSWTSIKARGGSAKRPMKKSTMPPIKAPMPMPIGPKNAPIAAPPPMRDAPLMLPWIKSMMTAIAVPITGTAHSAMVLVIAPMLKAKSSPHNAVAPDSSRSPRKSDALLNSDVTPRQIRLNPAVMPEVAPPKAPAVPAPTAPPPPVTRLARPLMAAPMNCTTPRMPCPSPRMICPSPPRSWPMKLKLLLTSEDAVDTALSPSAAAWACCPTFPTPAAFEGSVNRPPAPVRPPAMAVPRPRAPGREKPAAIANCLTRICAKTSVKVRSILLPRLVNTSPMVFAPVRRSNKKSEANVLSESNARCPAVRIASKASEAFEAASAKPT